MTLRGRWHRVFGGCAAQIPAATSWVEAIAADLNLPESRGFAMQLCLEELMTNIVLHGGTSSGSQRSSHQVTDVLSIAITVEAFPGRVVMTVEDNGRLFDVARAPARAIDRPLDQVEPGGLGIHLIKNFASDLAYNRTANGNQVIATFEG